MLKVEFYNRLENQHSFNLSTEINNLLQYTYFCRKCEIFLYLQLLHHNLQWELALTNTKTNLIAQNFKEVTKNILTSIL